MAELLNSFFKSVFNKKNKEKRFGQLGGNEDIVEIAPDKNTHWWWGEVLSKYPMAFTFPPPPPQKKGTNGENRESLQGLERCRERKELGWGDSNLGLIDVFQKPGRMLYLLQHCLL